VLVVGRDEIVAYTNELLEVERWPEFAPPGLQVVGGNEVALLVCGVSSSRELFERAAGEGADMVLVHHGLFWRNEPLVVDRRQRGRLEALFNANASLLAYHLALDAHPTLGNAAQLAARIGASPEGPFGSVGLACTIAGLSIAELTARVKDVVGREPVVFGHGPDRIERLAVSTGAAGYDLIRAAHEGFDALLTGEPEEPNLATAQELGIHLIAAGHHATERFGVQALAAHLAETFAIEWRYLEVENPV
jgi:dinuclear metal center YbgI/SA1388 family protein